MANGTGDGGVPRIRDALATMNSKIGLAILLVVISAAMVFVWMLNPPKVDASSLALLASMVTLFIKMAADACGYQFTSMAGADVKDQAQAKTIERLSSAVPAATAPATPVTPDALGEAMLTNGEKTYFQRLTDEEAKKSFLAMSAAERAEIIGKTIAKV